MTAADNLSGRRGALLESRFTGVTVPQRLGDFDSC
jgi:hypothetical protein